MSGWRRSGRWNRARGIDTVLCEGAARRAKAQDGWRRDTFASSYERRYAAYLRAQVAAGEVLAWAYEPFNLRLGVRCYYTPDFLVLMPDGTIEVHEVKGFWRDDARVKIRVAAETHPWFRFVGVTRSKGGDREWQLEEF